MQTKAPTIRSAELSKRGASTKHVDKYMATVCNQLRATLWEARAQWQKWYYNWKIGTVDLKPGNLVLVKADAFQGKRKIKDRWEDEPNKVVHQVMTDVPSYEVMDQCRQSHILHCNQLLFVTSETGIPLCVGVCQEWGRCTCPTPVRPTPRGSDSETTPWEDSALAITLHQASKTSLGWINGELCLLPSMSTRASTEDRWRLQVTCSESGYLQDCMHLAEGYTSPACRCHEILDWMTTTTTHGTESWHQDHWGYVTGMYPSMSSFLMTCHHPPWCGILPLIQRGTPTANVRVALFPQLIYEEPQGTTIEPNWPRRGTRACLTKNGG